MDQLRAILLCPVDNRYSKERKTILKVNTVIDIIQFS